MSRGGAGVVSGGAGGGAAATATATATASGGSATGVVSGGTGAGVAAGEDMEVSPSDGALTSHRSRAFQSNNNSIWSQGHPAHYDTVVHDSPCNSRATTLLANTDRIFKSFLRPSDTSFIDVMRNSFLSVASRISQVAIDAKHGQPPRLVSTAVDTEALIAAHADAVEASEAYFAHPNACTERPNSEVSRADQHLICQHRVREEASADLVAATCCLNCCSHEGFKCCHTDDVQLARHAKPGGASVVTLDDVSPTLADDASAALPNDVVLSDDTSLDDALAALPNDSKVALPNDSLVALTNDDSASFSADALATLPDDAPFTMPEESSVTASFPSVCHQAENEAVCGDQSAEKHSCTSHSCTVLPRAEESMAPFGPLPDLLHESSLVDSCFVAQDKIIPACCERPNQPTDDGGIATSGLTRCSHGEYSFPHLNEMPIGPVTEDAPLDLNEILFSERPVCRRSISNSPFSLLSYSEARIPAETTLSTQQCLLRDDTACSRSSSLDPLLPADEISDLPVGVGQSPSEKCQFASKDSNFKGSLEEPLGCNEGNSSLADVAGEKGTSCDNIYSLPMNSLIKMHDESLSELLNRDVSSSVSDKSDGGINSLCELFTFILENSGLMENADFDVNVREDLLRNLSRVGCEAAHGALDLSSDDAKTPAASNGSPALPFPLADLQNVDKILLASDANKAEEAILVDENFEPVKISECPEVNETKQGLCETGVTPGSEMAVHLPESNKQDAFDETSQVFRSVKAEEPCEREALDASENFAEDGVAGAKSTGHLADVPAVCFDSRVLSLLEMNRQLRDRKMSVESERFRSEFFQKVLPLLRHLSLEGVSVKELFDSFKLYPSICEPASPDVVLELANLASKEEGSAGSSMTQLLLSFSKALVEKDNLQVETSVSSPSSNRNIAKIIFIKNLLSLLALLCQGDHAKHISEDQYPCKGAPNHACSSVPDDVRLSRNGSHEASGVAAGISQPSVAAGISQPSVAERPGVVASKSLQTDKGHQNFCTSAFRESCDEVPPEENDGNSIANSLSRSPRGEQEIQKDLKLPHSSHSDCQKSFPSTYNADTSTTCNANSSTTSDAVETDSSRLEANDSCVAAASCSTTLNSDDAPTSNTDPAPTLNTNPAPTPNTDLAPAPNTDATPTSNTDPAPTPNTDAAPTPITDAPTPNTDVAPTPNTDPAPTPNTVATPASSEVVPVLCDELVPVKYVQLSVSIVLALLVHAVQSLSALMLELFLDAHRDGHPPY